ncbi:MAG: anhydro-N-acetylmuramic acid kinase [Gammaproteobacteria bacterium]|jgi:anhydro-N-acetylmuramic acid kinase
MPKANDLYIGLMSGTSLDAIDAALVSFGENAPQRFNLISTLEYPFPNELRSAIQSLIDKPHTTDLDTLGKLNRELGVLYANAVAGLLKHASANADDVIAIGCHGQTVRHMPQHSPPFTMQLGDPATIANITGIATAADFRSADIALGGQGAPLAPGFHKWAFANENGAVVNVGGIANITVLAPGAPVTGFDTGPGNTLMDEWHFRNRGGRYDRDGEWAASGRCADELLTRFLDDPYFSQQPPKSTGREYFNTRWIERYLGELGSELSAVDVQATLAELTARSIAIAATKYSDGKSLWLCGGGALNAHLVSRIAAALPQHTIAATTELGLPPDWVEAVAFAWLARMRVKGRSAGVASVTGASREAVLGGMHLPPEA